MHTVLSVHHKNGWGKKDTEKRQTTLPSRPLRTQNSISTEQQNFMPLCITPNFHRCGKIAALIDFAEHIVHNSRKIQRTFMQKTNKCCGWLRGVCTLLKLTTKQFLLKWNHLVSDRVRTLSHEREDCLLHLMLVPSEAIFPVSLRKQPPSLDFAEEIPAQPHVEAKPNTKTIFAIDILDYTRFVSETAAKLKKVLTDDSAKRDLCSMSCVTLKILSLFPSPLLSNSDAQPITELHQTKDVLIVDSCLLH